MESGIGPSGENGHLPASMRSVPIRIYVLAVLYSAALIVMSIWGRNWNSFKTFYGIWFVLYIVLMFYILKSGLLKRMERMNPMTVIFLIILFSLLLHLPFLVHDPSMSQDILRMERRGELVLGGKLPYRDFEVNKPPLYIWMVGTLSLPFGPDQMVFRIFFALINALVPAAMFVIHRYWHPDLASGVSGPLGLSLPGMNWLGAAIAYALCPLPILETGMAGHFDPVVVLATVISFYFLLRDRPIMSGLFLGLGFALKLYPMFLAPIFFLAFANRSRRIYFALGFFTVPVIASLPLLMVDPSLIARYIGYQFMGWHVSFSIRYYLEYFLSSISLPARIAYYLAVLILIAGSIHLVIRGFAGRMRRSDTILIIFLMFILSAMGLAASTVFFYYKSSGVVDGVLAVIGTLFSIAAPVGALYIYLHWVDRGSDGSGSFRIRALISGAIKIDNVPFLSSAALILLVLTSAQFHPWYLSWILPFALASGNPYWVWSTLLFFSSFQSNAYSPWEFGGL